MSDGGIEKIDLEKVDWRGSREFFESLGEALDKLDDKDESYDFTWVGKRKSIIEAGAPINKTLRPDLDVSKNWDTTENLFIEGDNLDALKLLQESYLGKVKMIYIDPPYNTGKDFVYRDNFKASVDQYDEDTEYKDEEGNIQFKKNEKSNGRYHSDWLSMMYPRLKLGRNLLSDDGVIFISIDDNEQANLKKLCDEIFGEDNLLGVFNWQTKNAARGVPPVTMVMENHEYILAYAKNIDNIKLKGVKRDKSDFSNPDNDPRGLWRSESMKATGGGGRDFTIINPTTGLSYTQRWAFSESRVQEMIEDDLIIFPASNSGIVRQKKFIDSYLNDTKAFVTNLGWFSTENSTKKLMNLFDGKKMFDFPKPIDLIGFLVEQATTSNDIVLDFFSGSGTTAHATMQLNAEESGNRKFIVVQLSEETDVNSEAYKAGYKTIPAISRERIRRAGDNIAAEYPEAKVDYGFRALRIDDTNHKDVYRPAAEYQQSMLDELVENVKEDRSDLDLLFGVLTATAWELNRPLETVELDGATVYKYDYFSEVSGLVACFADKISEEAIKQIAQLKPLTAVFKESSFSDSQAKVNLAEHFRILSSDTKVKVI